MLRAQKRRSGCNFFFFGGGGGEGAKNWSIVVARGAAGAGAPRARNNFLGA